MVNIRSIFLKGTYILIPLVVLCLAYRLAAPAAGQAGERRRRNALTRGIPEQALRASEDLWRAPEASKVISHVWIYNVVMNLRKSRKGH